MSDTNRIVDLVKSQPWHKTKPSTQSTLYRLYEMARNGVRQGQSDATILAAVKNEWVGSLPTTDKNIQRARNMDQNMGGRRRTRRTHRTRRTKHKRRTYKRTN
jgi:hypothetical protein